MKKIIGFVAICMAIASVSAQRTYSLNDGNSGEFFADEDMPDGFKTCKLHFTNITEGDITLVYEQISTDFPEAWGVNFCDNRDCLPVFPTGGTYAPIKPQETTEMKLDVFPSGGADSGVVVYAIWDQANTSIIDTLTFNIYARWGLNIQSWNTFNSKLYPNPATTPSIQIQASGIQLVTVRNMNGAVMQQYPVQHANQYTLSLQSLTPATYYVEVEHATGTDSHVVQYMP